MSREWQTRAQSAATEKAAVESSLESAQQAAAAAAAEAEGTRQELERTLAREARVEAAEAFWCAHVVPRCFQAWRRGVMSRIKARHLYSRALAWYEPRALRRAWHALRRGVAVMAEEQGPLRGVARIRRHMVLGDAIVVWQQRSEAERRFVAFQQRRQWAACRAFVETLRRHATARGLGRAACALRQQRALEACWVAWLTYTARALAIQRLAKATLQRRAFGAWRGWLATSRLSPAEETRLLRVATSFRRTRRQHAVLQAWHVRARHYRARREFVWRRITRSALGLWRRRVEEGKRARRMLLRAESHWQAKAQARCLSTWRRRLAVSRAATQLRTRLAAQQVRRCWATWRTAVMRAKLQHQLEHMAVQVP